MPIWGYPPRKKGLHPGRELWSQSCAALGRPVGIPRLPVHPLGPEETIQLTNSLREAGVLS